MGRKFDAPIVWGNPTRSEQRKGYRSPVAALKRLHHAYFSEGGQVAAQYGVSFADIVHHLWIGRTFVSIKPLRSVRSINDLILIVACLNGHPRAWAALMERCEYAMYCRGLTVLDESQALTLARRVLGDIRRGILTGGASKQILHKYMGNQPLRSFMSEVMIERLHEWGMPVRVNGRLRWVWNDAADAGEIEERMLLACPK